MNKPEHELVKGLGFVVKGWRKEDLEHAERNGITREEYMRQHKPKPLNPAPFSMMSAALEFKRLAEKVGHVCQHPEEKRRNR
jgi:hypothetical protein